MPPCLDVYVLSHLRQLEAVEHFIGEFSGSALTDDRTGEELMLLPRGAQHEPTRPEEYEWQPITTLREAARRGLDHPYRAFRIYLKPGNPGFYQAMLGFREDGDVVFGVSIDDVDESDDSLKLAKSLLARLADEYDGLAGFVAWEVPAPLVGAGFPPPGQGRVLFTWQRDALDGSPNPSLQRTLPGRSPGQRR